MQIKDYINLPRIRSALPEFRRGHTPRKVWLKHLAILAIWCAAIGLIGVSAVVLYAKSTLPAPDSIANRQVKESTQIYDRTGEVLLYAIYGEERRTVVPLDRIAATLKSATIAAEDANFYQHRGFDIKGLVRSLVRNVEYGYGEGGGGSTITQQLVGNALVGRQKTIFRKIQELILAVEVEQEFTKDQILEMYLNQIPYGSNAYGTEAAAQTFFGTPAAELTLAQSALLAGLPQRPSYLSPYGSHTSELVARQRSILARMLALGMIDQSAHDNARQEDVLTTLKPVSNSLVAPHFVLMVRDYLVNKYGEDIVEGGGLRIVTTLDADLQKSAEELVTKYAAINAARYKATNAALVAVDPRTGEVRALVGSANYYDVANEGNFNVVMSPNRQPGSAFKPFAYAAAFQKGYPDSTVLWDLPTEFNPLCPPDSTGKKDPRGFDCYHPKNYSGTHVGPVTMRQSLARSLNVTSVETLYLAGVDDTIDLATRMGITTLGDRSRFGLSLVLGGAEVRPIDLVSAYGVFANDGIRVPWGLVQTIQTGTGEILEQRTINPERVLDAQTSRLVTDVLADNVARASVFGANSPLYIPGHDVAAKTGTTQENRDAWVVGYTPSLAVGVWVGNNRNQSMTSAGAGISAGGPLWNAFMVASLRKMPAETFTRPDPVLSDKIMLNGQYISPEHPQPHSILFYVDRNNPLGPFPQNPEADSQFINWEWAVSRP